MTLEFTRTMMDTFAVAMQHHRLTGNTILMTFHHGTPRARSFLFGKYWSKWYEGVFTGTRDITINMTAGDEVLKSMAAVLFDD